MHAQYPPLVRKLYVVDDARVQAERHRAPSKRKLRSTQTITLGSEGGLYMRKCKVGANKSILHTVSMVSEPTPSQTKKPSIWSLQSRVRRQPYSVDPVHSLHDLKADKRAECVAE